MAKSFTDRRNNVVNVLSSVKVYSLTYFPHALHPNNALFVNGMDDDEDVFNPTLDIQTTYPLPLVLPTAVNAKIEDNIALKLVQQKNKYIGDVAKTTGNCRRAKTSKHKPKKGNIHSHHVNKLLELTEQDPDPYFFGSYNWYYTGGVLETASVYDVDFLFYVSGEKLNIFNSTCLDINNNQLRVRHLDSTSAVECDTIYEIIKSNNDFYVAARQKHKFTVFYLQDENAQEDFRCERNIPFMSGCFVDKHFFSIDAHRTIQRHDLASNKDCGRMYLKKAKNNSYWCQLKQYKNHLVFADEQKIKIYDNRLFGRKASRVMEVHFDSVTEKCEDITCIRPDDSEYNLYVATTHNLFVFDIRYGTESTNQLTRYTHQLSTPPLMIDATGGGVSGDTANKRLVALSGMLSDDIGILQHTKVQNDKLRTNTIPQKVLNTTDVYQKLKENGLQSESESLLAPNRLVNIGARFSRHDSQLFLLSEKASGEIWYQNVSHEEDRIDQEQDDKPLRNINKYIDDAPKETNIKATTVTNFSSMKKLLKFKLGNKSRTPNTDNPQPQKWQKSILDLSSYKDLLSADLLNVWQEVNPMANEQKPDNKEFVSGWINQSEPVVYDENEFVNNSQAMFE